MSEPRSPDGARDPIDRLRSAWAEAGDPPAIGAFLEHVRTPVQVLDAVRLDALERARRGLESGPEHYLGTLTSEQFDIVAEFLVNRELAEARVKGGDDEERVVRSRLQRTFPELLGRAVDSTPDNLDPNAMTAELDPYLHEQGVEDVEFTSGDTVGPYKIVRKLGEGGFGVVFLAERRDPTLRVALKVLRPQRVNESAIRRFKAEREALARLDHHGIARILSTGLTEAGLPYFAMQYIQGEWITTYCDRQRLTLKERLDLFAKVCDAVHHAHLNGIIHRDLSPDNILVSAHESDTPQPIIIDFGIARAVNPNVRLSEQTLSAPFGEMIGKREYMAPEQAESGQPGVDGRTDIYALGVILYELLVGVRPLDRDKLLRDFDDMIRFAERPDPSTRLKSLSQDEAMTAAFTRQCVSDAELTRILAGRVRHLPMKALVPDRTKRFSSASMMAADIRNYLDDKDFVEAAAEARWSVTLRFLRRNKGPAIAAALVFVALSLGVVGTSVGYVAAEKRRVQAVAAQREADAIQSTFLEGLLGSANPYNDSAQVKLADQIAEFGERLAAGRVEALDDPDLPPNVRVRLVRLTGDALEKLGAPKAAIPLLEMSLELARERQVEPDPWTRLSLVRAYYRDEEFATALQLGLQLLDELGSDSAASDREELRLRARLWIASCKLKSGAFEEAAMLYNVLRDEVVADAGLDRETREQLRLDCAHDLQLVSFLQQRGSATPSIDAWDAIAQGFDRVADEKVQSPVASQMWILESRYEAAKARYWAASLLPTDDPERAERFSAVAKELENQRDEMLEASGGKHWRFVELVNTLSATYDNIGASSPALKYSIENYELNIARSGRDHEDTLRSMRWMISGLDKLGYTDAARWFAADALFRVRQSVDIEESEREELLEIYERIVGDLGTEIQPED